MLSTILNLANSIRRLFIKGTRNCRRHNKPGKKLQKSLSALMAIFGYPEIFLFTISIIFLCACITKSRKNSSSPTNWPVVGMLPEMLRNINRIHDYVTEILSKNGGTFEWKGPWFCSMNMLVTSDPSNIHYIFSRNFSNYPKGPEFRKIFEILGDGIFNADFEMWELHRRNTLSFMSGAQFYSLLEGAVWEKVQTGLLPVLDYLCKQELEFDLQDVLQRLTFDSICKLIFNSDPGSLSVDMPYVPAEKAFNSAVDALLHRHVVPEIFWRLQNLIGIGKEKKLKQAWKAFDQFIYPRVDELKNSEEQSNDSSLLSSFRKAYEEKNGSSVDSRHFLRDTALNLMFAGRDTTSTCLTWLFWLIAVNPSSAIKIREEIEAELHLKEGHNWRPFSTEESRKLVYLHGALCESLRLFPPVALEHKAPFRPDKLPTGNYLEENSKVIVSFYSVGRMESVWGEDCLEFKPERWITERRGTKHEPSYKFPAFNAGSRTCLGKEMAFIQMKMVAATIIYHYNIKLTDDNKVNPSDSIILQAKHGLKVRLFKRNVCGF